MRETNFAIAFGALISVAVAAHGTESSVPFVHADQVHWQGITGFGVTVAVIDAGVNYGEYGLAGDIAPGGVSFVDGTGVPTYDGGDDIYDFGHGTLVSLIITDPTGVAPDAKILPIRVIGAGGTWDHWRDVVDAIKYVTWLRKSDPSIRVINLSLGTYTTYSSCLCDLGGNAENQEMGAAIREALNEGIVTFACTMNNAECGALSSPACVEEAVKVAGNYDADYSGYIIYPGLCQDIYPPPYYVMCSSNITGDCMYLLAAPGYDITVGDFQNEWGTSFAVAHCSGVAALMFSKNACGGLSANQARQTIWSTATNHDFGWAWCYLSPLPKHLDALAAVNAVSGPACPVAGDLDCDGLVSGYDFPGFETRMNGPGAPYPHTFCACTDFSESPPDGDVDLRDLRLFSLAFDGMGSGACCHGDSMCSITTIYDCLARKVADARKPLHAPALGTI